MTKLLEDFVAQVGAGIEQDFGLQSKTCWRILKGQGDSSVAIGIAPTMAALMDDQIPLAEVVNIISQITALDVITARSLVSRMCNDGLLSEEGRYIENRWIDTIRLPYQRFSDHLISRHLLARHLDCSAAESIRRCFRPSQPLGKIFKAARWGGYDMPGLVSAIMLEFPERVKRAVHPDKQELAFYIPTKLRTYSLSQPFIDGLLWRDTESFSKQTDLLVQIFLKAPSPQTQQEMLEALVILASRSEHRYNAEKLRNYLNAMTVPDRDLFWTEFLRSRHYHSVIYRILDWVQASRMIEMEQGAAKNLITLIALLLTSTMRPFRDRATHCLVILGETSPGDLFAETLRSFTFNDPYVRERLLAAAYGVLMRQWAFPPMGLAEAAGSLGLELKLRLEGTEADAPMEHSLMRDYAQGIIELAAKLLPDLADQLLKEPRRVSPTSVLCQANRISEKSVKEAKSAIRMDFGNYTIGRLAPGRANYDDSHKGYRAIRRQIERRILDLGYNAKRFEVADRVISETSHYAGRSDDSRRTDRYGKKYSWIAFYEVAGRLALRGRLRDKWEVRISDTDIDPSFPSKALEWQPSLPNLFGAPFTTTAEWLQHGASPRYGCHLVSTGIDGHLGPWVLLDGFIAENAEADQRQTFTFLRGMLVQQRDIRGLRNALTNTPYPGNHALPEPMDEHYLFAGEIGWSDKYGFRKTGRVAGPDMGEALERRETEAVSKRYGDLNPFEKVRALSIPLISAVGDKERQDGIPSYGSDDLVILDEYRHLPGFKVEVPIRRFSWESYHSQENQSGGADYPSPAIVRSLNLRKSGSQIDMVDPNGKLATVYRVFPGGNRALGSHLLYMRADLLEQYLKKREMSLVWINWGEREVDYNLAEQARNDPNVQALWGKHTHIHEEFFLYESDKKRAKKLGGAEVSHTS